MARQATARKSDAGSVKSEVRSTRAEAAKKQSPLELDRLIHERLTFNDLKALLQTTDGNLSVHARKLEDAEYLTCEKSFDGRVPRTEYRLTAAGRRALEKYLVHMEAIIKAVRD